MLSCDKHDLIEIACMYKLKLLLKLKSGTSFNGVAQDTCVNDAREECITFKRDDLSVIQIPISIISSMHSLDLNPHFETLLF